MSLVIGTAGWSISRKDALSFGTDGTALQRYASRFGGVEINSSFYRPHRPTTWTRWADSVPSGFRFAVKVPRAITHERLLVDCAGPAEVFVAQAEMLGPKLAVLLVQLPPKLGFDPSVAADFFEMLTSLIGGRVACEPRHPSWFDPEADELLSAIGIARVAADPAIAPGAALPGGWRGLSYWRLHGSPVRYRSSYDAERLAAYAALIDAEQTVGRTVWCIFDNTASSLAMTNALALTSLTDGGT